MTVWVCPPQAACDSLIHNIAQQHGMLKNTIGANYPEPVRELLNACSDRRKYVGKSSFVICQSRMMAHIVTSRLGLRQWSLVSDGTTIM
jgi:hypothetical protein